MINDHNLHISFRGDIQNEHKKRRCARYISRWADTSPRCIDRHQNEKEEEVEQWQLWGIWVWGMRMYNDGRWAVWGCLLDFLRRPCTMYASPLSITDIVIARHTLSQTKAYHSVARHDCAAFRASPALVFSMTNKNTRIYDDRARAMGRGLSPSASAFLFATTASQSVRIFARARRDRSALAWSVLPWTCS